MKRRVLLWLVALALALCPAAWAGTQASPEETPEAEETREPEPTPVPASEKQVRAAFEEFLVEMRGLPPGALKTSEIRLSYDAAQESWVATCQIDLDAVTTDYKAWLRAYEGSGGIGWNLLTAVFDREGALDFSHPQWVNHEPPPEFPVSEEKAVELALVVVGLQYDLKQKQLDALEAIVLLRSPKGDEDPDYYEYHIEFLADDRSEQGARIWRYLAKVDTQTGQVLSVVHKDDPNVDFAPARR